MSYLSQIESALSEYSDNVAGIGETQETLITGKKSYTYLINVAGVVLQFTIGENVTTDEFESFLREMQVAVRQSI